MRMAIETSTSKDRATPLCDFDRVTRPVEQAQSRSGARLRIADVILLAGSVRSDLAEAAGRSRLDLPLDRNDTFLNHWQRELAQWMSDGDQAACALRVLVQPSSPLPSSASESSSLRPRLEIDPHECRGTGGLLRDLSADYDGHQWLLVATAAQVLLEPLDGLIASLREVEGDVRLMAHADGTPVGLMLVRSGCLRGLEKIGFIDFKEQGLPRIARDHRVGFVMRKQPTGLPVRTHRDYIRAVRWHHLRRANPAALLDPFAEDWRSTFSVVEPGAEVHPSARLHDCVVLREGRVEADATVVRSVVCPGAVVPRGRVVVDQLVRAR